MSQGSERIRERRLELGLSQTDLARRAGVSLRTVQFAEAAKTEMGRATIEAIVFALNMEYQDLISPDDPNDHDALLEHPWKLFRFVKKSVRPGELEICKDLQEAQLIVEKMRASWRPHLENSCSDFDIEVFGAADCLLDEKYPEYEDRYLSIWQRNPRTICVSGRRNRRTGVSVVLPVTDRAYENVRDGKWSFMDVTEDDILPESQNLIMDSLVEFPDASDLAWYQLTDSLNFAVFAQVAALSINSSADDFRMLSFGASPVNIQRLESKGFAACGSAMPKFGFTVLEFMGNDDDLPIDSYERSSTVSHLLHLIRRKESCIGRLKATRRVVVRALRAFQLLTNPFEILSTLTRKQAASKAA